MVVEVGMSALPNGLPLAPPRSGWGRWKTVGSYEAVVEEGREPSGSGFGSSAAPLPVSLLLLLLDIGRSVGATFDARYF